METTKFSIRIVNNEPQIYLPDLPGLYVVIRAWTYEPHSIELYHLDESITQFDELVDALNRLQRLVDEHESF